MLSDSPSEQPHRSDRGPDDQGSAEIVARLQNVVTNVHPSGNGSGREPETPAAGRDEAPSPTAVGLLPPRSPRTGVRSRLGEALLEAGVISPEDLERALVEQRQTGTRLGETLVALGLAARTDVNRVLAQQIGVPLVDLEERPPDMVLANVIPENIARRYGAIALERGDDHLVVAMADPNNVFALDDLRLLVDDEIVPVMADEQQIRLALDRIYQLSEVETTLDDAAVDYEDESEDPLAALDVNDGPVVRLVNALFDQAITSRASDIHVEPTSKLVHIRYRVDGVLHDTSEAPLSVLRPLVTRLKVMAALDIAQSRVPQDGRLSLSIGGRSIDVRVATVPTSAGEAVVLRLLDPMRGVLDFESLGLTDAEQARLSAACFVPQGGVFVTGPTGTGKTSTLYAVLSKINTRDKSVVSVEDPVEYRLDGVKQIQINPRAGLTFPSALRSILRADPDVILIGEVRDDETARIAADASMTGHLVLSTLHTTRAAGAPMRLVDMGVEPYMVASSLTCVVAQRLTRRLCDSCAVDGGALQQRLFAQLGPPVDVLDDAAIRMPVGCPACLGTGYRGRTAIFEIMPVSEGISRLIVERASSAEIERLAVEEGMDTIRVAAMRRVARGEISIEEMLRVV